MKIVSFPHYTCGGLLCEILNDTFSPATSIGSIDGIQHKMAKIGDSASVFVDFDKKQLLDKLKEADTDSWIGTHCWLGNMVSDDFQVINITTATYRSRLYRWTRAWYHMFVKTEPWQNLDGMTAIDKQRETAKNYVPSFDPVHRDNFVNLEFADVVECTPAFVHLVDRSIDRHIDRWRTINHFLYKDDVWTALPAQRLHEAEYELKLRKAYVYG